MKDSQIVKNAIAELLAQMTTTARAALIVEHIETLIDLRIAELMDELSERLEAVKQR